MSQPFHQLQPPNNTIYDENVSINASHNVAVYTLGMMTTPPQASWDGRGHVLIQPFKSKLSESGAGAVQQLPIHNDFSRLPADDKHVSTASIAITVLPAPAVFTNTSMLPKSHLQSFYTPSLFGAMCSDGINSEIAQGYGLATGPLHYDPSSNIGSFYCDFSEPTMVNSKDIIVLLLGIDDEPCRETLLVDEDMTLGQLAAKEEVQSDYGKGGENQLMVPSIQFGVI
ncbi:hypothetical protein EDD22DRAFT_958588 [Suillus occidentalis]|nr:hypothetical protein EDD22DRAFT_958588 [Suillus occidentalis]